MNMRNWSVQMISNWSVQRHRWKSRYGEIDSGEEGGDRDQRALYMFIAEKGEVKGWLCDALVKALGGGRPTVLTKQFWQKVTGNGEPTTSAIDGPLTNPPTAPKDTNLDGALDDFERAAARFKLETNRCAVLVLDNVNVIAQTEPTLLSMLQAKAKFAADNDLYLIIFVCTDGVAPIQMKGKLRSPRQLIDFSADSATENSAWSRASEFRIGDLTTDEAMQYLREGRGKDPVLACRIIEFCGTRVWHLKYICTYLHRTGVGESQSSCTTLFCPSCRQANRKVFYGCRR
jgi:hypothetical protein